MDIGTKEDNERRRRREAVKDMLTRIEVRFFCVIVQVTVDCNGFNSIEALLLRF